MVVVPPSYGLKGFGLAVIEVTSVAAKAVATKHKKAETSSTKDLNVLINPLPKEIKRSIESSEKENLFLYIVNDSHAEPQKKQSTELL